ncbi:MAG: acylphosphatase [Candidatus Omnitrophica bacterium]|nr:acylphosphatase [Candidatus Omnitrophota bacterium]
MGIKQAHIFYSGIVQGVGFRYRSQAIAKSLNIRGWVRNLADGRVEIIAQANESELDEFIITLESSLGDYIKNKQVYFEDADEILKGFDISF